MPATVSARPYRLGRSDQGGGAAGPPPLQRIEDHNIVAERAQADRLVNRSPDRGRGDDRRRERNGLVRRWLPARAALKLHAVAVIGIDLLGLAHPLHDGEETEASGQQADSPKPKASGCAACDSARNVPAPLASKAMAETIMARKTGTRSLIVPLGSAGLILVNEINGGRFCCRESVVFRYGKSVDRAAHAVSRALRKRAFSRRSCLRRPCAAGNRGTPRCAWSCAAPPGRRNRRRFLPPALRAARAPGSASRRS